jgi:hypothetical protein
MEQANYDLMLEELGSTTNLVEKDMLLQKYGLIEPKLTPEEKLLIELDENDEFNALWDKVVAERQK